MTAHVYPTLSYDYDNNGNITKVYENGVEKERYYNLFFCIIYFLLSGAIFTLEEDTYGDMLANASLAAVNSQSENYAVIYSITEISGSNYRYVYQYGRGWTW